MKRFFSRGLLAFCGLLTVQVVWGDWIQSDASQPFGLLNDTNLAYSLLQEQSANQAFLTLGGALQADLQAWGANANLPTIPPNQYPESGSALALTTADLYTLANLNNWTQVFFTLQGGLNGYPTTFSEAVIDFGNLSQNPFYASLGEAYLPFGVFPGGGLVASTLEASAFESAQLNQIDLGFAMGPVNTNFVVFNGQNNINDFVYNLQYSQKIGVFSLSGGAGYINDLRYSGSAIAAAYGTSGSRYTIQTGILNGGSIGAVSVNAGLNDQLTLNQSLGAAAEWVTTTSSPSVGNIPTGKMQAWSITANYNVPIWTKNTTFAIDYSATVHMQAVPMPMPIPVNAVNVNAVGTKDQWLGYVQSELAQNIYLGPEFAWTQLYNGNETWESTLDLSVYI